MWFTSNATYVLLVLAYFLVENKDFGVLFTENLENSTIYKARLFDDNKILDWRKQEPFEWKSTSFICHNKSAAGRCSFGLTIRPRKILLIIDFHLSCIASLDLLKAFQVLQERWRIKSRLVSQGRQFAVSVKPKQKHRWLRTAWPVDPKCGLDLFRDRTLKRGNPLTLRRRFLFDHCQLCFCKIKYPN